MSNPTLELLDSHRSDRSFLDKPVDEAILAQIVEAAHRGPTSINAQHISLVVVRDPVLVGRRVELAGARQAHLGGARHRPGRRAAVGGEADDP